MEINAISKGAWGALAIIALGIGLLIAYESATGAPQARAQEAYVAAIAKVKSRNPDIPDIDAKLIAVGETPGGDCNLLRPTQSDIESYATRTSIPVGRVPGFLRETCLKSFSPLTPEERQARRIREEQRAEDIRSLRKHAWCAENDIDCSRL
ncbi:hypothetical protein [Sphingopyxis flava]|uniref:Uncharacterized protein n=1 Tax=Sphingopyxis flava TaxID=1507287 RepID=A0A1T5CST5_9SPHN|nr:hypothetical protein [Sphingopyxis flava]SKB62250.1 hypothetical protein SAMN06295937_101164 [Sphingopyxis flava]